MKSLSKMATSLFSSSSSSSSSFHCPSSSSFIKLSANRGSNDAIVDISPVYLRSMFRRPPTIMPRYLPRNSCSFTGTVIRPVKEYAGDNPMFKVYTVLEVKNPTSDLGQSSSKSSFRILLEMWKELSEISLRHLKPNDFIYVTGSLRSFEVNARGNREIHYKVIVSELNFVRHNNANQQISQKKPENAEAQQTLAKSYAGGIDEESVPSGAVSPEEKYKANLHLWQVFFASPNEWWDNRKDKKNPRWPDFKHKDTKECLWLNPNDPPWVSKQLELYDSRMGIQRYNQQDPFEWKVKDIM